MTIFSRGGFTVEAQTMDHGLAALDELERLARNKTLWIHLRDINHGHVFGDDLICKCGMQAIDYYANTDQDICPIYWTNLSNKEHPMTESKPITLTPTFLRHLYQALCNQNLVLEFDYPRGDTLVRRAVSPIRVLPQDKFLAYDLTQEEPRTFIIHKCFNPSLHPDHDYQMPHDPNGKDNQYEPTRPTNPTR
jgi:hypothetical protein